MISLISVLLALTVIIPAPISAFASEMTSVSAPIASVTSRLTGLEQDEAQPVTPSLVAGENEYTHPEWGLIFDYPSDWAVSIPDFGALAQRPDDLPEDLPYEPNLEYMRTLGHHISLYPTDTAKRPAAEIMIAVDTFTISPGTDLQTWVDLVHELNAIENPLANETTVRSVEVTDFPFAAVADQVVYDILENSHFQIATIWLAKGELVFILSTSDQPEARQVLEAVAASVRFDEARMAELRAKALFSGDENAIIDTIQRLQPPPTPECDSICRDAKILAEFAPINPSVQNKAPVQTAAPMAYHPSMTQKVLPPTWLSPIRSLIHNYPVNCGSSYHTGAAEFAVDVGVSEGTSVYAMEAGTVVESRLDTSGYGELVLIRTPLSIADEQRVYYHAYAHLKSRSVITGQVVYKETLVGYSGHTTGREDMTVGNHLHYHIRDTDRNPVDATPVLGFKSDLDYPNVYVECGTSVPIFDDPIVIESKAFTQRYQRSNVYWLCINPDYSIAECYMRALPDNEIWFDPLNTNTSPELRFNLHLAPLTTPATWYVWVCGDANNDGADDSIHLGVDNAAPSTLKATLISSGWTWMSSLFPSGQRPTFTRSSGGSAIFNVWVREDGARFSRILLTTDPNYNPTGLVQCGPY